MHRTLRILARSHASTRAGPGLGLWQPADKMPPVRRRCRMDSGACCPSAQAGHAPDRCSILPPWPPCRSAAVALEQGPRPALDLLTQAPPRAGDIFPPGLHRRRFDQISNRLIQRASIPAALSAWSWIAPVSLSRAREAESALLKLVDCTWPSMSPVCLPRSVWPNL